MSIKSGTLVVLPCHGVYDPITRRIYAEHPDDEPIYEAQIFYAFKHMEWIKLKNPLLVISGGFTKKELKISESQSYIDFAEDTKLKMPKNIAIEEFALVSIENLLFSLYKYKITTGYFPNDIHIVSWEFKKDRYFAAFEAIKMWPLLRESLGELEFFSVGNLVGNSLRAVQSIEKQYIEMLAQGLQAYYQNPRIKKLIKERDVYNMRQDTKQAYKGLPFPW